MQKKLYFDEDANLELLDGRVVAVVGYGTQGTARAMNMRDSGLRVIVGEEEGSDYSRRAKGDGFKVVPTRAVADEANIFDIEIPDMAYRSAEVYNEYIGPNHKPGDVVVLSSAFNYYHGHMQAPEEADAIVCAPKGPGSAVRGQYLKGGGVPGLLAIHQDNTGNARQMGLALCKAIGFTRVGVMETSVREETLTDLLGEHCSWGAIVCLVKTVFEVMVEEGFDSEIAFYEAINESKLTTDLIYKFGMAGMLERISNTAAYGAMTIGPTIIDDHVKENIRLALRRIEDGSFDRAWRADYDRGYPEFKGLLDDIRQCEADRVGNAIRDRLQVREEGDFQVKNV